MKVPKSLALFIALLFLFYGSIYSQLNYVPPISVEAASDINLTGILLFSTDDARVDESKNSSKTMSFGTISTYPSSLQIVDPKRPWPPIFFAHVKLGDEGMKGNSPYGDFRYQYATGKLSFYLTYHPDSGDTYGRYFISDTNFNIIDTIWGSNGGINGHDLQINSKGERLYAIFFDTILNISQYTGDYRDTAVLITSQKLEITDSRDSLLFLWNPMMHIPIADTYMKFKKPIKVGGAGFIKGWNWSHMNSVGFTSDGNIVYSYRQLGVGKVNRKTGELMWKLGGKSPTIPTPPGGEYYLQHDFHEISPNIYSIFSNGTKEIPSRGIVYEIDEKNSTARVVRIVEPPSPIYSLSQGNFEIGKDGQSLLNFGKYDTIDYRQKIFEIFDGNDLSFASYSSPSKIFTYQVHHVPSWRPSQPVIINESGTLMVSESSADVEWYKVSDLSVALVGHGASFKPAGKGTFVASCRRGFGWIVSEPYVY